MVDVVKSIFGLDPAEYSLAQQKMNIQAQQGMTPYERMGYNLANIGGGLFGVEDAYMKKASTIQSIVNEVSTKYDPNSPDFYKALSAALPGEMMKEKVAALGYGRKLQAELTKEELSGATELQKAERYVKKLEDEGAPADQIARAKKNVDVILQGKAPQINIGLSTVDKESNNRKDFTAETKQYRDVYTTAGRIESLLNQGPLGEIIAKKQFSKLAGDNNISNRDVEALSNFGDIGQRLAGTLSQFANGVYSESQVQEARNLVKQLRKESESSYNEIKGQYRNRLAGEKLPEKTINFIAPDLPSSKTVLQLPPGTNYKEGAVVTIKGYGDKRFVIRNGKAEEQ